jgi:hypothetical protein
LLTKTWQHYFHDTKEKALGNQSDRFGITLACSLEGVQLKNDCFFSQYILESKSFKIGNQFITDKYGINLVK